MVREPALRGHHAPVLGAPGRRAARHHRRTTTPWRARRPTAFYDAAARSCSPRGRASRPSAPTRRARPWRSSAWGSRASTSAAGRPRPRARRARTPGPDLASYPLSQVPDEAAVLVRALLTADRNQQYLRARMTEKQRAATPAVDFRPFIIADADTGHGGDPHVRNLVRRFVEVGVPGYHIEDQRPGTKKCGHQGGKVLVPRGRADQAPERGALPARRHEGRRASSSPAPTPRRRRCSTAAATSATSRSSSARPTSTCRPTRPATWPCCKRFYDARASTSSTATCSTRCRDEEYRAADELARAQAGSPRSSRRAPRRYQQKRRRRSTTRFDQVASRFLEAWEEEAGLETYGEAVAEVLEFRPSEGEPLEMSAAQWRRFAERASLCGGQGEGAGARRPHHLGLRARQDPRGLLPDPRRHRLRHRQVARRGALRRPPLDGDQDRGPRRRPRVRRRDPRRVPGQDAGLQPVAVLQLGLDRDERRGDAALPRGARQDGLRLQLHHLRRPPDRRRRRRGVRHGPEAGRHAGARPPAAEDPPRRVALQDAADARRRPARRRRARSPPRGAPRRPRRWARARRSTSTWSRPRCRRSCSRSGWRCGASTTTCQYKLRREAAAARAPARSCSSSRIGGDGNDRFANVVFAPIQDRRGRHILSVRDQNTFDEPLRKKRLMTLVHLFLVHRYKSDSVHYVTPTEDNQYQTAKMKAHGIFSRGARPRSARSSSPTSTTTASRSCSRPTGWRCGS